mmetsp:Transcript_1892/g.2788  ORF Transcript_1892/g.2788 Transcript_1892/m.2788 type:complete len:698 (-) Transcript_1892:1922-4015(-)
MSSPFTSEHVQEWKSFGPRLKGKPANEEERLAAVDRKGKCTAMKKRLAEEISSPDWTEKKIEKELDRLALEANKNASINRPSYLDAPSGTRDFYPPDLFVRNWLFGKFKEVAAEFGFVEYDAPVLEHVELYERKAGEEIVDQMYNFVDKEGDHVTLRPEMTPTLARLVLNQTNLSTGEVAVEGGLPLKWFSIPQCWRFETTQRGRKREHYQWNMDMVGVEHVHAEVELLAAASSFFRKCQIGPDVVGIKVNSRKVLEALLAKYGVSKQDKDKDGGDLFSKACVIIDKLDKIGACAVKEELAKIGISEESSLAILKALDAPSIEALAEIVIDDDGSSSASEAIAEVQRLFSLAKDYGFDDYLIFDASVVRGLAYYTGIVWEAFDRRGELRAIMGGGRYDRLLELYGGKACANIPCVGFGFGDCVIMELLNDLNLVPRFTGSGVDYVVCAYNQDLYGKAAWIASQLRASGKKVDLMPTPKKKVANSFKHADVSGARRMVFVAPDEVERSVVRIKDLRSKDPTTGEAIQVDVPLNELHTVDQRIQSVMEKAPAVFDLAAWKSTYLEKGKTSSAAVMDDFWSTFDKKNWSIWKAVYDYPDDNEDLESTKIIVTDFMEKTKSLSDSCFGVMQIYSSLEIEGLWLVRGEDPELLFGTNEDTSWFTWSQLGPDPSDQVKSAVAELWTPTDSPNNKEIADMQIFT